MNYCLIGTDLQYSAEQMLQMLFPGEKHTREELPPEGEGITIRYTVGRTFATCTALLSRGGKITRGIGRCQTASLTEPRRRQILMQSIYRAALPHLSEAPPWGALAGVRPVKLATRCRLQGAARGEADRLLRDRYFVSPERRKLCLTCSDATLALLQYVRREDPILYVGIPFCPSRCIYCSFVSQAIASAGALIEPYLAALHQEIDAAAAGAAGRHFSAVYIGGGTPTTLSAPQLHDLLTHLRSAFSLPPETEITVEAGRPDTITPEKLAALAAAGVERVSVNPQTMDDRVLTLLGRHHTAEDIRAAYAQARQAGFACINMDLIAGLPGDSVAGFRRTLEEVIALGPENITVHTLALKKAATLYYESHSSLPAGAEVRAMVDAANARLRAAGYRPYYLYRQKNMTGSLENVGWAVPGTENAYNILMMEELCPVLALGAGGVSKQMAGGKIRRLSNPKYPKEYIQRISTISAGKKEFFSCL